MFELLEGLHAERGQTTSTPATQGRDESTCHPSTLPTFGLHPGDHRRLAGRTDDVDGLVVVEVDHADGDGIAFITADPQGPCT